MPDPDLSFKVAVINKIIAFKHLVFIIDHSPKGLRVVVIGGGLRQRIEAPEELFQSVCVLTVVLLPWGCGLDPWGGLRLSWESLSSFRGRDPALQSPATWSSLVSEMPDVKPKLQLVRSPSQFKGNVWILVMLLTKATF